MTDADDLERWADDVLDQEARLQEHLTDSELRDRDVLAEATFYMLADGCWLIADPRDPAMRRYLIEDELMSPDFADDVLAKMRALDAERDRATRDA